MTEDQSADETDAEIRHLVEKGLSVAEVAEEVGLPEEVIEEWQSRQSPEGQEGQEGTAGVDWTKLSE